jgi:acetylornithine/N-succinyldiaminopimelate aminotransferase
VLDRVSDPHFLADVRQKGQHLGERLSALVKASPLAIEARGMGLMWGVECKVEAASIVASGYKHGILCCAAGPHVVRLLPPLTVTQAELDELVDRLGAALKDVDVGE